MPTPSAGPNLLLPGDELWPRVDDCAALVARGSDCLACTRSVKKDGRWPAEGKRVDNEDGPRTTVLTFIFI